jgi:hypothetical protein
MSNPVSFSLMDDQFFVYDYLDLPKSVIEEETTKSNDCIDMISSVLH